MTTAHCGFRIAVGEWDADILADCVATSYVLGRYLAPWIPRARPGPEPAQTVLEVRGGRAGEFEARADGQVAARSTDLKRLIPVLESVLDENIVDQLTGVVPIHAGVAVRGGEAVMFPGRSHAGKSTLVKELLRCGWDYWSDEFALIDAEGRAHPYPRPLMLRDREGHADPLLARECDARTGSGPAPVRMILALQYAPLAGWAVHPLAQSETLLALLSNTPRYLSESADIVPPLMRLASVAPCYAGTRGEAGDAVMRIAELLTDVAL